jgi:hypothetical protein
MMGGIYSMYGEMRNSYKILVGKPEEENPLWRSGRRCDDKIKMDLKETGFKNVECIYLIQTWYSGKLMWT